MADDDKGLLDLPHAITAPRKRTRISMVWIVPIVAAVVAVGIAVERIWSEGPTITVVFKSAQGIEAGKSVIRFKDVNIGQVTAVQLSADYGKVEVTAKIAKSAAGLMVEDAQFWVVRPRITLSEISGLNTLLSGNYIGFEAGKSSTAQRVFAGLETPQVLSQGVAGRQFTLKANELGGAGVGSPIYYRRVPVGQVSSYDLTADGKAVDIRVFFNAPYDQYVKRETRFWNAGGLDVSVGANGINVRAESLAALLSGSLAFDTPASASSADTAAADSVFTLHRDQAIAMKQPDAIARHYVLHFRESLQGLSVGAPVTFLGLSAGEVTAVGLTHDSVTHDVKPRVDITIFPERLLATLPLEQQAAAAASDAAVRNSSAVLRLLVEERGMRGQLRSASLLTGQLYIALDYFPAAGKTKLDWSKDTPELPVTASTLPDLQEKLSSLLAKLDKVPLETISADTTKALESLDQTLKDAGRLVNRMDAGVVPELRATLEEARGTLSAARRVMKSAESTLVGPDAPAQQELRNTLQEVDRAAHAIRVLADSLERRPESLIRGRLKNP
jgi:paraquat-inducible protein B